jgi:hypothetical protein
MVTAQTTTTIQRRDGDVQAGFHVLFSPAATATRLDRSPTRRSAFAPGRLSGGPCGRLAGRPGRPACRLADLSGGGARAQLPRWYRRRQRSEPLVWAQSHRRDPYVL